MLREHILIRQELIFAGVVVSSEDATIKAGDQVIVTGYDLGMNTSRWFRRIYSRAIILGRAFTGRNVIKGKYDVWDSRFYCGFVGI